MSRPYESPVRVAVLNPRGRDPHLDYSEGIDIYRPGVHAPVNFHAYAAATFGAFFDSAEQVLDERKNFDAVVVLIRKRCWITLEAVRRLKSAGMKVFVAWKECGHTQITNQLRSPRALLAYEKIIALTDLIISPTHFWPPRCGPITHREFTEKLRFVPTPYPVDYEKWDFSIPIRDRRGIMIGTREFHTLSRNHIHAVSWAASMAHDMEVPVVTVINTERKRGMLKLRELAKAFPLGCLRIIEKPLGYLPYMDLLASHRLVFQMDRSGVPGQVAGDSLLARVICAGGSSTIEQIAFPGLGDDGTLHLDAVFEKIKRLMADDQAYREYVALSQEIASEKLSFASVARRFGELVERADAMETIESP